jgi:anti-sigma factor RsiW
MNEFQNLLIWKYLDGECTNAELQQVESLRESDPAFESTFKEAEAIHFTLKAMQAETPPMRFATAVMEKTEDRYRKPQVVADLFSAPWRRIAIGTMALVLSIPFVSALFMQSNDSTQSNPLSLYAHELPLILGHLAPWARTSGIIALGLLAMLALDQGLRRWFLR